MIFMTTNRTVVLRDEDGSRQRCRCGCERLKRVTNVGKGYILLGKRSDSMLWMAVTADRFELPLCVEESATLLARKLHTTESTIRSRRSRQNNGKICGYRIVAVEEER